MPELFFMAVGVLAFFFVVLHFAEKQARRHDKKP